MGIKNENMTIIDDGTKVFPIYNKAKKKLGEFVFAPSDTNIVDRYKEVQAHIENMKAEDYPNNEDGLRKMEDEIVKQIDYLTNADAKESFFTILGPLTPLYNGDFFFENILNAIASVISQEMKVRLERSKTKVRKYTEKYHK